MIVAQTWSAKVQCAATFLAEAPSDPLLDGAQSAALLLAQERAHAESGRFLSCSQLKQAAV